MPRYAVFLRAVNVGGRRVTMDALRRILRGAGCTEVETLIASGNVALGSPLRTEAKLVVQLEAALASALGFEVDLFVRSAPEMTALTAELDGRILAADETLYVAFLSSPPEPAVRRRAEAASTATDTLQVRGREVLWSCRSSFRESPFSGPALEKLLGVSATVRKSTTVARLAAKVAVTMRSTLFDPGCRSSLVARIRRLRPDSPRRWGRMSAPLMVAHLIDQMTHALGDVPTAPVAGILRNRLARYLAIYWLPWPKGRLKGPPEAFVTSPGNWRSDVDRLIGLVERLAEQDPAGDWPPHALFGSMRGADWGSFCVKHFDHHLRQFGV